MDPMFSVEGTSDRPTIKDLNRAMRAADAASSKPPAGPRPVGRLPRHGRRKAAKGETT